MNAQELNNRLLSLLLGLLVITTTSFGQSLYNSGAQISILSNTVFSVGEDLVNNGTITNNGNLIISGTWRNNSTYNAGMGSLTLNSSNPQTVNHNDQSFTTLAITGGGEKLFEADITIQSELMLTEGVLTSVNGARIIFEDGAVITGGSDLSFVNGPIYHRGTGNKLYPLGANGLYLPIELVDVKGTNPEIGFTVVEPNTNTNTDGSFAEVSSNRYWQMDLAAGAFDGSAVALAIANEAFLEDVTRALVVAAPTVNDAFVSLGQTSISGDLTDGFVTSELESMATVFAIGKALLSGEVNSISVFNAVSPNNDGLHEFLKIVNITFFPGNDVRIYNRWGDLVFEMKDYDNQQNVFRGDGNVATTGPLADGTYYYTIDKNDGSDPETGFLVLRR